MDKILENKVDNFLKIGEVKEQFDFIVKDSKNTISSIRLVKDFKDHINEVNSNTFHEDNVGSHFVVWLMCSSYPICIKGRAGILPK